MDGGALLEILAAARKTIAVAESFTGGRILDALTDVPGSSRCVRGGLVAYSDEAKQALLDVPAVLLTQHGAVSGPVARAMAAGVRRRFGADYAVATSGIAGPGGATVAKPLGLSFVAAVGPAQAVDSMAIHPGDRTAVKDAAHAQAMACLRDLLRREGIL